jgi:hypothetical protein
MRLIFIVMMLACQSWGQEEDSFVRNGFRFLSTGTSNSKNLFQRDYRKPVGVNGLNTIIADTSYSDSTAVGYGSIADTSDVAGTYTAWTLSIWFFMYDNAANYRRIVDLTNNTSALIWYSGKLQLQLEGANIATSYNADSNKWVHVCATGAQSSTKCYIDGVQIYNGAGKTLTVAATTFIGKISSGAGSYSHKGKLHDFVFIPRAIEKNEIIALMMSDPPKGKVNP